MGATTEGGGRGVSAKDGAQRSARPPPTGTPGSFARMEPPYVDWYDEWVF